MKQKRLSCGGCGVKLRKQTDRSMQEVLVHPILRKEKNIGKIIVNTAADGKKTAITMSIDQR